MLITVAVMALVTGTGVFTIKTLLPTLRADAALEQMLLQLRRARTMSVNQRRNFTVTFQGTNELVVVRQEIPTGTTPISDTFLPGNMVYTVFAGVPDTPDNFGNPQAVNFACGGTLPCSIVFQSDGSVLANGTAVNGTVFMGLPGNTKTARAVTVMGPTGRLRGYRYNNVAWF
jgi:hypothetical protein